MIREMLRRDSESVLEIYRMRLETRNSTMIWDSPFVLLCVILCGPLRLLNYFLPQRCTKVYAKVH